MSEGPYKVVELSTVTDEAIEATLNEWTEQGYTLEGIHFAMRESSKRPAMAFIVFNRTGAPRVDRGLGSAASRSRLGERT